MFPGIKMLPRKGCLFFLQSVIRFKEIHYSEEDTAYVKILSEMASLKIPFTRVELLIRQLFSNSGLRFPAALALWEGGW